MAELGIYNPETFKYLPKGDHAVPADTQKLFIKALYGVKAAYVELQRDEHFFKLSPGMRKAYSKLATLYPCYNDVPESSSSVSDATGSKKRKTPDSEHSSESSCNPVNAYGKPAAKPPSNAKKRKPRQLTANQVLKRLKDAGVENLYKVSGCVKAAIARHFIRLENAADLDVVIGRGNCRDISANCEEELVATLRMILYQEDNGGGDYYPEDSGTRCGRCGTGYYVSQLCLGTPDVTIGKWVNHCNKCPRLGTCVVDYRDAHCDVCHKHYYGGSIGQFGCYHCDPDCAGQARVVEGYERFF